MIYDSLKHIEHYRGLGDVYTALKFLANSDLGSMTIGRHELTDRIYYVVQEYETQLQTVSEAHEGHIDIQLLVFGEEIIGVAPIECQKQLLRADPEHDVWNYACQTQPIRLTGGEFLVLYPNDLHMPCATLDTPVKCRKVLVKIKI